MQNKPNLKLSLIIGILLAVTGIIGQPLVVQANQVVAQNASEITDQTPMTAVVPDQTFQQILAERLDKPVEAVTVGDLATISYLEIPIWGGKIKQLPQNFEGIQYLNHLNRLNIAAALASDGAPDDIDLSKIADIPSLQNLEISGIFVPSERMPDFSKLTNLDTLALYQLITAAPGYEYQKIDNQIFEKMMGLPNLTSLTIEGTNIDSIAALPAIKASSPLTKLDLSENKISDFSPLGTMNLQGMDIDISLQKWGSRYYEIPRSSLHYDQQTHLLTIPADQLRGIGTLFNGEKSWMGKLAYDLGSLDISGELKETDDGWQTDQPLTQSQFSQLSSLSVRFNGNLDLPTPPGVNSFQQGNNIFANYITIEPDAGQPVTVYYRDENGDDLAPAETLTGSVGQNYQTTAKEFPDYQLKKVAGNTTGQFSEQPQTVTYVYTKQQADQGTVTVKYQDAHGQDLLPPLTLTGQVGTDYQTTACEIPNYKLRTVQGSQLGKFTSDEQTIIYQYEQLASDPFKPEPTPTPTDEPGNQKPGLLQVPESLLETIDNP